MADKPKIREAVIVEGRDDTINLKRAVDCFTIETHGFGIKRETWEEIAKAYKEQGIIIFTDPDFSGNEIRRRLTEAFPEAKQAYLLREDALKKGDIGVENAEPEAVVRALMNCRTPEGSGASADGAGRSDREPEEAVTMEDLFSLGLTGEPESRRLRELAGRELGIGYANGKGFLRKLNGFGIGKEELNEVICTLRNKGDQG